MFVCAIAANGVDVLSNWTVARWRGDARVGAREAKILLHVFADKRVVTMVVVV